MTLHEILSQYLKRKKLSIRSLAPRLGISPSFLSRILSGKKGMPVEVLEKLIIALDIESEMAESIRNKNLKKERVKQREVHTPLSSWDLAEKNSFSILRQWYYLAILDYTTTKSFDGTVENLAIALGLHIETATVAVKELLDKGLLEKSEGRYRKSVSKIRWSSAKSISDIRGFHLQMLDKAKTQLLQKNDEHDFKKRLIMGVTLTVPYSRLEEAKERINSFIFDLSNELTSEPGDEVYHLTAQLFPLSESKKS